MQPSRLLARLLAGWRAAAAATGQAKSGSVARSDAERTERRAQSAYDDQSVRQHDRHDRPETWHRRINRINGRVARIKRDVGNATSRGQHQRDEEEFRRELGEDA